MKERNFDEMIAYFNRRVSEMDIAQDYKMELLGMVTALGYKHEKTAQQWIPCSENLPKKEGYFFVTDEAAGMAETLIDKYIRCDDGEWVWLYSQNVVAWMPLPAPYKED